MGTSGKALYRYLEKKDVEIFVYDNKLPEEHSYQVHDPSYHYDLALLSPGIPLNQEIVTWCTSKNIEVQGEIQFAASLIKGKLLGITGTNGKSTTVSLLYEIIKKENDRTFLAGNIGTPLIDFVEESKEGDIYVVELSSFQLETTENLDFYAGAILNITPDHILWHGSYENYQKAKFKLLDQSEYLILNAEDQLLENLSHKFDDDKTYFFSKIDRGQKGAFVTEGYIYYRDRDELMPIMKRDELFLEGDFNLENALCGIIFARLIGIPNQAIVDVLKTFKGISHRYEYIGSYKGITVINDSKATNPESTIPKIKNVISPTILIAGGMNKGSDFTELAGLIKDKIKKVYLFGENKGSFLEALTKAGYQSATLVDNLEEAFNGAMKDAVEGDTVLLSPASASWDMYESYEKRGDHLRNLYGELQ